MDDSVSKKPHENITLLQQYLDQNNFKEALALVRGKEYKKWMEESSWDIIPVVAEHVTMKKWKSYPLLVSCCQEILMEIAMVAMPEEAILEFLDQMDVKNNEIRVVSMLQPVFLILNRLPSRRSQSLNWCLSTLKEAVWKVEPEEEVRIVWMYNSIQNFYTPFIKEVLPGSSEQKAITIKNGSEQVELQLEALVQFLLNLLAGPLVYLDIYTTELAVEPISRNITSHLSNLLPCMAYPLMYILDYRILSKDTLLKTHFLDENVPDLAFQILYYLVFALGQQIDKFPAVYSPLFLFSSGVVMSSELMMHENSEVQNKGLHLLRATLDQVSPESIPHYALEDPHHEILFSALCQVTTYNTLLEKRQLGTELLKRYLKAFDNKGRYLFIMNGLQRVDSSGLAGYLIMHIKEFALQYINIKNYYNSKLKSLVQIACTLPEGDNTLLFEEADRVISALNLVRFLILRDPKPGNLGTGIWDIEEFLMNNFVKNLKKCLKKSRSYLERQLNDALLLKNEEDKRSSRFTEMSVKIGSETLDVPKFDDEIKSVKGKQTSVELVGTLLDRVLECL